MTWHAAPTMWPVCPDCGSELEWDPGRQQTFWSAALPATMYCDRCDINHPEIHRPKPDTTKETP